MLVEFKKTFMLSIDLNKREVYLYLFLNLPFVFVL